MQKTLTLPIICICLFVSLLLLMDTASAAEITGTLSTNPAQTVINNSNAHSHAGDINSWGWGNAETIAAIVLGSLIVLELLVLAFMPKKQKVIVTSSPHHLS